MTGKIAFFIYEKEDLLIYMVRHFGFPGIDIFSSYAKKINFSLGNVDHGGVLLHFFLWGLKFGAMPLPTTVNTLILEKAA